MLCIGCARHIYKESSNRILDGRTTIKLLLQWLGIIVLVIIVCGIAAGQQVAFRSLTNPPRGKYFLILLCHYSHIQTSCEVQ